jgi:hypothetical protein
VQRLLFICLERIIAMKIDTGTSTLYATQRAQSPAAGRANSASFAAVLSTTSKPEASGVKQADFTSMTRQEMRDWTNDQIRSGQMSLDDGRPFMAMTMNIPVSGGAVAGNEAERVDFTQTARAGIAGALERNDQVTRKMLESAMTLMEQFQGQTIGIDTRA